MRAFDVAIAGAGPAGLACALRAAQHGLSVALFDPQGSVVDKPCGEGILPSGVAALRALGLADAERVARPFDRIEYVVPHAAPLELALAGLGWAIWRTDLAQAFERALARYPRARRFAERVELAEAADELALRTASGTLRARCFVLATGLAATRALGATRAEGRRFGARVRCAARRPLDRVVVALCGACEVYLTPLPRDAVNVAVLIDAPPPGLHTSDALIAWALARSGVAGFVGEPLHAAAARDLRALRAVAPPDPRVLLAGDAAGSVDPVIGCGVALALTSGIGAADAALELVRRGDPRAIAARHVSRCRRERRAKQVAARVLRALSRRPRCARAAIRLLRAAPRTARRIVAHVTASKDEPVPVRAP